MINEVRLKIADFLNTTFLDNKLIFLNLWHVIHFISGAIVMFFILKLFKKYEIKWKLMILLISLVLYEVLEWSLISGGSAFFRGETKLDILGDLVFGFLGGLLVYFTYPKKKR